jgi:hypothetical protein
MCDGFYTQHLSVSFMDVVKGDYRIYTLTPEIYFDQSAMGLPPVMSAVFLIAKEIW